MRFSVVLCCWIAVFQLSSIPGVAEPVKAGFARRDITPKEPVPMWGYGARHASLSEGVLEPLWADAVVFEAAGKRLAIVGLDLGRSPSEASLQRIRQQIASRAGIRDSFISGSHTHHGPVLELNPEEGKGLGRFDAAIRYYAQMEQAIADAVVEAANRLAPARLSASSLSLAGFNRNRHSKLELKAADTLLSVLRVDDTNASPMGLLINFTAHPTMLPAETLKFSPDYVGALKRTVLDELGAPAVFLQGASGDMSTQGNGRNAGEFGKQLGQQAVELARKAPGLAAAPVTLRIAEERFQFKSRTDFDSPLTRMAFALAFFPELVANYVAEYSSGIRPRLTVALLNGQIGFVGVSGEFFCSHAVRLRERARLPHLFFVGYCNGYHQYFPTIEAAAEGGYGADSRVAPVEVGAGEQIMNRALVILYEMQGRLP